MLHRECLAKIGDRSETLAARDLEALAGHPAQIAEQKIRDGAADIVGLANASGSRT
ncbi:MAG: hypothetical protein AAF725_06100 [Acidobacteriota bacterium]